jgi:iron complex transport system permease protein
MKITLDLTDLVAKGQLSPEEARRLEGFAAQDTGALGVNILMAFGTVAVALGAGFFVPNVWTAVVVGGLLFAVGLGLTLVGDKKWGLFAQICMTIGALAVFGALSFLSDGSLLVNSLLVAGLAAAAIVARSGLLIALAVLGLTSVLGGSTSYWHATYGVSIFQPTLTIGALAIVAIGSYLMSKQVPPAYERVAIIAARTATLLINVAFLVGSLFGDVNESFQIPDYAFSIVWAILLIGVGLWGIRVNRRWVVNTAAVFGAIHFYTQWFETLGPSPVSILGGGLLLIAFGFGLKALNGRTKPAVAAT